MAPNFGRNLHKFLRQCIVEIQLARIIKITKFTLLECTRGIELQVVDWVTKIECTKTLRLKMTLKTTIQLTCRRVYHIVTDHAFWVESIVTYHRIYRKKCIT